MPKPEPKIKSKIPKVLTPQLIKELEQFGATRMDKQSMCALLDCSVEEFDQKKIEDPEFGRAILRGKAKVQKSCAAIIVNAIQQPSSVSKEQLQAAMFWLERHAPHWQRER